MIKQYTPSQILQLYSQTPADVQDTAVSERTADRLRNTVLAKYKLSDENLMTTAQLLGLVLFGLLHPDEMAANLQKELNIEPARAKALYRDIWEIILKPIEGSLRNIHGPIKTIEEAVIETEFKPPAAPLKPTIARIEEIKKEAPAPPPIKPVAVVRPTPLPPPIRPVLPKKEEPAPNRAGAYLEPIEEEIKPPVPTPPRPVPPKAEKIEIGGIPVEVVPKKEATERPITPPRISSLYLEPVEEEEPPQNIVDLRSK